MNKKNSNQVESGKSREGWNTKRLSEEASQQDGDEIQRQMDRGDESKGNPNERDIVGSVDKNETAHGREEAKNDIKGKANVNG